MYDADTIEAINVEQLVTATDRMLLRGRVARRRPSAPSLPPSLARHGHAPHPRPAAHTPAPAHAQAPRFAAHTPAPAHAQAPRFAAHTPAPSPTPARDLYRQMIAASTLARGSQPHLAPPRYEPTLQMRAQPSSARAQVLAITVVIPTLVGIAVGLAALL